MVYENVSFLFLYVWTIGSVDHFLVVVALKNIWTHILWLVTRIVICMEIVSDVCGERKIHEKYVIPRI